MRVQGFAAFEKELRGARPGAVFLVCGPEPWQAARLRAAARCRYCEGLGFEYRSVYPDDLSPGDIPRMVSEPSLFSPGRLFRFAEADRLPPRLRKELLESLGSPAGDALLVESGDSSMKSSFNAAVDRIARSFVCWEPFERDLQGWCDTMAAEEGLSLTPALRSILVSWCGGSLSRLADAVTRASLYASGRRLEPSELAGIVTGVADPGVFDLADEVWAGRTGGALSCAWRLIRAGEEPVALLALLYRQWERFETARRIVSSGGGARDLQRELGLPMQAAGLMAKTAAESGLPPAWISSELFASSDWEMKSGADASTVFAGLIHALTRGPKVY